MPVISFQVDFPYNKVDAASFFKIWRVWGRTSLLQEFYKLFHLRDS